MATAFLFPGQGSQSTGMLHQLPAHKAVDLTMEEASTVLLKDVQELDTSAALGSTIAVQLALLVSGVAMARVLIEEVGRPEYVAGHSVGAFGAAVASKVLSFPDALKLVELRARLMETSFPVGYGMGVITGIPNNLIQQITEDMRCRGGEVFVGNINALQQTVISGSRDSINEVFRAVYVMGARKTEWLQVPVPSHCPLLESVSQRLDEALKDIPMIEPEIPYAANTTARLLYTAKAIRNDLVQSIVKPVLWFDAATMLYERGARLFVEMPPGSVLTNLASQAFPSARAVSSSTMRLDSLIYLLNTIDIIE